MRIPARRRLVASVCVSALAIAAASCGGEAAPPAAGPAAATEEEPPHGEQQATIDVYCEPPTPILLDGKPIGSSPLKAVKVTPGAHDVTFADPVTGNRTMSVTVEAGENRSVISDKPKTSLDVTPGSAPTVTKTK